MALKLRPTGLGSGIDKDRPDYTVYSGGWDVGRIYETRGGPDSLRWFWSLTVEPPMTRTGRCELGGGEGAVSEELGCMEGMGEAGGGTVTRLEQRGAVAFAFIRIALVILLIKFGAGFSERPCVLERQQPTTPRPSRAVGCTQRRSVAPVSKTDLEENWSRLKLEPLKGTALRRPSFASRLGGAATFAKVLASSLTDITLLASSIE